MKYIGNKTRLLEFIQSSIQHSGICCSGTLIDIFGGTGAVGTYFKQKGLRVIANDIMTYSYIVQYALIEANHMPKYHKISSSGIEGVLDILNNPRLIKKGYFFENFAPSGKYNRQYFSDSNALRIDAMREQIEEWYITQKISESEYYILLSSLIDAVDFVANISGTYGAYLKIWRSMALKPIHVELPKISSNNKENLVRQEDANKLIREIKGDILYLDPPYNERQYASNFHVLETLAVWDKQDLRGKTGQRDYSDKKSLYCKKAKAAETLEDLIEHAKVKYIVLSYNDEGIISRDRILKILEAKGDVEEYIKEYRRFRTELDNEHRHYKNSNNTVNEHLYVVKCKN